MDCKEDDPFRSRPHAYVRLSLPPMGFAGELHDQLVDVYRVDALGNDLIAELEHDVGCQPTLC